ncbi:MAG: Ldh family oxidoreductase [Alphaproteobacteria bacterium]|nr:Ldh family oxidoreductase [Alphaproteobacteria bacterium]
MPTLMKQELESLTADIFRHAGAPVDLAQQVAEVLVDNHMAGHDSHGILRIPEYLKSIVDGEIVPTARPEVIQETPVSALVQGHWALGQATGIYAADLAIAKAKAKAKAKAHHLAVVSVVQAAHTGRLAAFTERAARQEVVMFMAIGTVDRPMTAPFGGAAAVPDTNPVAFSLPNPDGPPITLDIATSAIAAGKVKVAKARHENLPPDVILDKAGRPSVNPQDFIDGGFLLPFGGHKGYALAVIAELLSGPLIGAESFPAVTQRSGIFIFAMDAALFRAKPDYAQALAQRLGQIKGVPPAQGFTEVLVPGEPEARTRTRREKEGIPIPDDTWQAVRQAAQSVGCEI